MAFRYRVKPIDPRGRLSNPWHYFLIRLTIEFDKIQDIPTINNVAALIEIVRQRSNNELAMIPGHTANRIIHMKLDIDRNEIIIYSNSYPTSKPQFMVYLKQI
jgi:hypothetical protein